MLAASGNDIALDTLVNHQKQGLLKSTAVGATVPRAEKGIQKAIDALAGGAGDARHHALWYQVAQGLSPAAGSGNSTAIDALIATSDSTNRNARDAVLPSLTRAAGNDNLKAAQALRALGGAEFTQGVFLQRCRPLGLHTSQHRRCAIFVEPATQEIIKLRQERHLPRMANTYTQIYLHVVFAVESRQNLIAPEHNDGVQRYITGIVSGQGQKLIAINKTNGRTTQQSAVSAASFQKAHEPIFPSSGGAASVASVF